MEHVARRGRSAPRAQTDRAGRDRAPPRSREALMDTLADLHARRPGRASGWPTSAARRATWSGRSAAGAGSWTAPAAATCRASTSCATRLAGDRAGDAGRRAIVHGDYRLDNVHRRRRRPVADRRRARLGDGHPRRPAGRPRAAADVLGRARRQRRRWQPGRRRARPARRLPDRRRADRRGTPRRSRRSTSAPLGWYVALRLLQARRHPARASTTGHRSARPSARASTASATLVAPLVDARPDAQLREE